MTDSAAAECRAALGLLRLFQSNRRDFIDKLRMKGGVFADIGGLFNEDLDAMGVAADALLRVLAEHDEGARQ